MCATFHVLCVVGPLVSASVVTTKSNPPAVRIICDSSLFSLGAWRLLPGVWIRELVLFLPLIL